MCSRQQEPHQVKKQGEKCKSLKAFTGTNGSAFMLSPSGPDRKSNKRTQERSTLLFSTPEPPPVLIGTLGFSVLFFPHQVTGRPATGTGFYWATMNDTAWLTTIQSQPCHTCSGYTSAEQLAPKLCSSFGVCWSASICWVYLHWSLVIRQRSYSAAFAAHAHVTKTALSVSTLCRRRPEMIFGLMKEISFYCSVCGCFCLHETLWS